MKYGFFIFALFPFCLVQTGFVAVESSLEYKSLDQTEILKRHMSLPANHRQISLDEAIEETLQNQREILINILNVPIQEGIAWSDLGPFDLVCSATLQKKNSHDLIYSSLGPRTNNKDTYSSYSFQISKLNRLGTQVSTSLNIQKNYPFNSIQPLKNNESVFSLNIEQPLLKDFYFNESNATLISDTILVRSIYFQTLYAISSQVLNSINALWELKAAQDLFLITKQGVDAYTELLLKTQIFVENNEFASYEILQPLAQLDQSLADLEAAQQTVYQASRQLMLAIGGDEYVCCNSSANEELLVTDQDYFLTPVPSSIQILDDLLCNTVNYRSDILAQAVQVLSTDALLKFAKNQTLPAVNLFMQLQLTDYATDNESKKIFSASKFRKPENDWLVGITFSFPFCNSSALGDVEHFSSLKTQQILQTEQLQQNAIEEVKIAWRNHESLLEELIFLKAEDANFVNIIDAEKTRLDFGLKNIFEFIQYISQLVATRQQIVIVKKQIAQNIANIRHLTGTLLTPDTGLDYIRVEDVSTVTNSREENKIETL